MRNAIGVVVLWGAFACGESAPPPPEHHPDVLTVAVTTNQAPSLVAFQDGLGAPWEPAVMTTPESFAITVHGPYVVTVVCEDEVDDIGEKPSALVLQAARTLDDPPELSLPCRAVEPPPYKVTGRMRQDGSVRLGPWSSTGNYRGTNWDFTVPTDRGTYDLIAATPDALAVRRGVVVDGDVVVPTIDVLQEGSPYVNAAIIASNVEVDESIRVSVGMTTATTGQRVSWFYSGLDENVKLVAESMLLASDTQHVEVSAGRSRIYDPVTSSRSVRHPFQLGDSTLFTLPPEFTGVVWSTDGDRLSVTWETAPLDRMQVSVWGYTTKPAPRDIKHVLDVGPAYLAALDAHHLTLDTDIPGFQPDWRFDPRIGYQRQLSALRTTGTEVLTSVRNELVNVPIDAAPPAPSTYPFPLEPDARRVD